MQRSLHLFCCPSFQRQTLPMIEVFQLLLVFHFGSVVLPKLDILLPGSFKSKRRGESPIVSVLIPQTWLIISGKQGLGDYLWFRLLSQNPRPQSFTQATYQLKGKEDDHVDDKSAGGEFQRSGQVFILHRSSVQGLMYRLGCLHIICIISLSNEKIQIKPLIYY